MYEILRSIILYAIPTILAITLHEAAHGYVAKRLGDNTAWVLGRVTLNPLKHIDPVGTILVPGILLAGGMLTGLGGVMFGWAKPVPVNFARLRNPKFDMIWVALAGPASNFVQALLWALVAKIVVLAAPASLFGALIEICYGGITVNLVLMAFNLLPALPLDGGRIIVGLLPWKWSMKFAETERYGLIILAAIIFSGVFEYLARPVLGFARWLFFAAAGA